MLRNKYISLGIWIIVFLGVSFTLGQITQGAIDSWYSGLEKSNLNPPSIAFPIVWSALYIMIATAGWYLWRAVFSDRGLKALYIVYVALNWAWTPLFFGAQMVLPAFAVIMALNVVNAVFIIKALKKVPLSAYLMIPPLLWTSFAAFLNFEIWRLNG